MSLKRKIKKFIPTTYDKSESIHKLAMDTVTDMFIRTIPKIMLDYEVQLVEHCNLNCASCSHFCPVAEPEFLDINEYEKDVKRLSLLFDNEANFIRLMGGEPLLHPKIKDFFKITRKYFPNAIIDLDTNGILLKSMKDEFYNSAAKYNINISVTRYPVNIDYEIIKDKCNKFGVNFRFFDNQVVRKFNLLPLDLEGRQQIEKNFVSCYLANCCHTLKHGKMYTCSTIPHISHFNKKFNKNLIVSKRDCIDIYEVKDAKEILDFLAKPVPFCRYCNVHNRIGDLDWKESNKQIEEWVYYEK
ncbi:MAG: radical SAM protein [Bacilli bacterium]|nr:radical SAM protein [Bacilli bacterium]